MQPSPPADQLHLPTEAAGGAVRLHEAAARLAEQAGLRKQALAHRELAAKLRPASFRVVERE